MNLSKAIVAQVCEKAHLLDVQSTVPLESPLVISLDEEEVVPIGCVECNGRMVIVGLPRVGEEQTTGNLDSG